VCSRSQTKRLKMRTGRGTTVTSFGLLMEYHFHRHSNLGGKGGLLFLATALIKNRDTLIEQSVTLIKNTE